MANEPTPESVVWNRVKDFGDIEFFTSPEGIAKIAINRPEVHNAFRPETLFELAEDVMLEVGAVRPLADDLQRHPGEG